jgi:undecaprenyl-diphosphatase
MSSISNFIKSFDSVVASFFSGIHTPFFDSVMPWLTDVLISVVFVFVFGTIFILAKKKKQFEVFWAFIVSTIGSFLVANVLKHIIGRERPLNGLVDEGASFSFPSNHSVLAVSMYGFLVFLVCRSALPQKYKILLYIVFSGLIVLVGASRLYLGVHYLTDVLGGYVLGFIFVLISTKVVRTIEDDTV